MTEFVRASVTVMKYWVKKREKGKEREREREREREKRRERVACVETCVV